MKKGFISTSNFFMLALMGLISMPHLSVAFDLLKIHEQPVGIIHSDHTLLKGRSLPISVLVLGEGNSQELVGIKLDDKKIDFIPTNDPVISNQGSIALAPDIYLVELMQGWTATPTKDLPHRHPKMSYASFHFNPSSEAKFTLTYLENADVFGGATYKHIPLEIRRQADGQWAMLDQQGRILFNLMAHKNEGGNGLSRIEIEDKK